MAFNLIQFFENLFSGGKSTAAHPSTLQSAVDVAGKALDDIEVAVNTLQGVAPVLPDPFKGYVATLALVVHDADAYVDTIETQTPTTGAVPQPAVAAEPAEAAKTE